MIRRLAISAFLLTCAASVLRADEAADALLRDLFARDDPAAAGKQIDALLAACGNDVARVRALIASDAAYEVFPPGWLERKISITDDRDGTKHEVGFSVRVPPGYTPKKSWPLLLVAHGQNSTGPHIARSFLSALGEQADRYVLVAPTLPGEHKFGGWAYQEQAFLAPLRWTCRNLNIDDDRVYVSGYSLGGHTAWHLATMFPHLFAAAIPLAGMPFFEGGTATSTAYLENLSNLPVWAVWGELDGAPPPALGNRDFCRLAAKRLAEVKSPLFRPTELKGKGHGGCWPERGELARFLADSVRRPVPDKLEHRFHLPRHSRLYYLDAVELARKPPDFSAKADIPIKLPPGAKPTPENVIAAMTDHFNKQLFKTWAALDRPANAVEVRAESVKKLRLDVTEGMLDPARPVKLKYWQRTWEGPMPVSARCILLHYADRRDQKALILNEIDLQATLKPAVRFPS